MAILYYTTVQEALLVYFTCLLGSLGFVVASYVYVLEAPQHAQSKPPVPPLPLPPPSLPPPSPLPRLASPGGALELGSRMGASSGRAPPLPPRV
jgi:hypothetical protein